MAIQCLVGEEQNFVTDPMLNGKPMQFSQHRANMVYFSSNEDKIWISKMMLYIYTILWRTLQARDKHMIVEEQVK